MIVPLYSVLVWSHLQHFLQFWAQVIKPLEWLRSDRLQVANSNAQVNAWCSYVPNEVFKVYPLNFCTRVVRNHIPLFSSKYCFFPSNIIQIVWLPSTGLQSQTPYFFLNKYAGIFIIASIHESSGRWVALSFCKASAKIRSWNSKPENLPFHSVDTNQYKFIFVRHQIERNHKTIQGWISVKKLSRWLSHKDLMWKINLFTSVCKISIHCAQDVYKLQLW